MALRSIPRQILTHKAVMTVPGETDRYANSTGAGKYDLSRVHFQPSTKLILNRDSQQVRLTSVLFYDARLSLPRSLDFDELKRKAEAAGGRISIAWNGNTYHVESVDWLPDDRGNLHHYELGLV